jgi:hypothetical protein
MFPPLHAALPVHAEFVPRHARQGLPIASFFLAIIALPSALRGRINDPVRADSAWLNGNLMRLDILVMSKIGVTKLHSRSLSSARKFGSLNRVRTSAFNGKWPCLK